MTIEPALPASQEEVYFLPSTTDERTRLALQHNLIIHGADNKLIHAPVDLGTIGSILETATGSGIWLEEVAKIVPATAELIGTDITTNIFPPSPPPNIEFLQQSVLDLPKEWTNKFDLVHQRLLVFGLRNEEWRTAINEIFRVLKPGGWFQLYEIDEWENCGPCQQKLSGMMTSLLEARGGHNLWPGGAKEWESIVKEIGFEDIRVTWHGWPMGRWAGEEGLLGIRNFVELVKGCKAPIIKAGGFGIVSGEQEYDELVVGALRELDILDRAKTRCIIICGQKPM